MTVREYVLQNFSEEQKFVFDYIIESFPEHILKATGEDSEDILLLIAIVAKIIGKGREQILFLRHAHDLKELYNNLNEETKSLIVPLLDDMKYPEFDNEQSIDEKLEIAEVAKPFVEIAYQSIKKRGTRSAIKSIVESFLDFINRQELPYELEEIKEQGTVNIVLGFLEDYVDYTHIIVPGTYSIKKDAVLYKMLMAIKPAGILYNVVFRVAGDLVTNFATDKVIRNDTRPNANNINSQIATYTESYPSFAKLTVLSKSGDLYYVEVDNYDELAPAIAYISDWPGPASYPQEQIDIQSDFKQITNSKFSYSSKVINPEKNYRILRRSTSPSSNNYADMRILAYLEDVGMDGILRTVTEEKDSSTWTEDAVIQYYQTVDPIVALSKELNRVRINFTNHNDISMTLKLTVSWILDSVTTSVQTYNLVATPGVLGSLLVANPSENMQDAQIKAVLEDPHMQSSNEIINLVIRVAGTTSGTEE